MHDTGLGSTLLSSWFSATTWQNVFFNDQTSMVNSIKYLRLAITSSNVYKNLGFNFWYQQFKTQSLSFNVVFKNSTINDRGRLLFIWPAVMVANTTKEQVDSRNISAVYFLKSCSFFKDSKVIPWIDRWCYSVK